MSVHFSPTLTGIFGGSFDPPHLGHAGVVETFWKKFPNAKELLIVPNRVSPWKQDKSISTQELLFLVEAQFSGFARTRIWDWELNRESTSYTDETIQELLRSHPQTNIALLIGDDNYNEFHKWRNWNLILENVSCLLVFRRISENIEPNPELKVFEDKILFLDNPIVLAASTDIRSLLPRAIRENKKPIALSQIVWEIILKNGSYR